MTRSSGVATMPAVYERYLDGLRRSQFASPERLAATQHGLLERLARHAHEYVPHYRARLAGLFKDGEFRRDAWSEVPVITRPEVQAQFGELQAQTEPAEAGAAVEGSTAGSSGSPLAFRQSHLALIASRCQWERMLEVHRVDTAAHLATIRIDRLAPYPQGRETTGWNFANAESRHSCLHVGTPIAEQTEWLLRCAPKYLMTYPSNAAALALQIQSLGAKLPLSGVLTFGEHTAEEQRELITREFGCRIFDSYGATEVGFIAFECPAGGGYHLASESVLAEITDEDGGPLPAGTLGRVVLTALYNYAMPFIRYAIGDYAVAAEGPCGCGRTLPRLAGIAGRSRNVFTFADGSQQSPWGWRSAFVPLIAATQMQIVQTTIDKIEIRYVPAPGGAPVDPVLIEEAGRRRIHPSVVVLAIAVDEIPRLPSGKIEDCISLVTSSLWPIAPRPSG